MRKISRSFFTLIEVLIAMGLISILLSTVAFLFYYMGKVQTQTEAQEEAAFKRLYVENRLADTMSHVLSPRDVQKDFYFYTSQGDSVTLPGSQSLVFIYDNGHQHDSAFSSQVLGRLFISPQKQLTLATWPLPKNKDLVEQLPVHFEVLMQEVESLSFQFYSAPQRDRTIVFQHANKGMSEKIKGNETPEPGQWFQDWKINYMALPEIVKIHVVNREKEKEMVSTFVFVFPHSDKVIVYERH